MSSYPVEEGYRTMISCFRTNDLQALLGAFNRNKNGRKSELKDRALELLTSRPTGFNYQAYLAKVLEIYRSMQNDTPNNNMLRMMPSQRQQQQMMSINMQPSRMYRPAPPPNYPQQSMHISRGGLPQVMPQMQRGMYANNIPGNNIQYNYQPGGPRNIVPHVPTNQQVTAVGTDHLQYDMNNANTFTPSTQSLAKIRFKKLPFYQVLCDIIKPTILVGQERCSLPNTPRGMREVTFKINMTPEQINCISLTRDVTKNEYIYQTQIRICLLEPTSTEITDFLPIGLHIRVNNKVCLLPPTAPSTRPGTEARRTPRPINCSQFLKLSPCVSNTITVNWTPDGKTYVMVVYLVEKLSSSSLLQKLNDKGARSSDETKEYIIKNLADVDPDLATTHYRFSLVCPLGKMRMRIPAKSINCAHLQCFDASTFILMNEKKPTWLCPTCNKPCLYDDLQIQTYFLEVISSSSLPESCKEIEILADGTWRVYEENKKPVESAADKEKPIDSVTLDDSDEENSTDVKKETSPPESSNKETEHFKTGFVDLTLSDEEEPPKDKDKQENEAQAADAVQPATTVDLTPQAAQAQVQPQQAVTSSEQGVVIEIDCSPSPPATPPPPATTTDDS